MQEPTPETRPDAEVTPVETPPYRVIDRVNLPLVQALVTAWGKKNVDVSVEESPNREVDGRALDEKQLKIDLLADPADVLVLVMELARY